MRQMHLPLSVMSLTHTFNTLNLCEIGGTVRPASRSIYKTKICDFSRGSYNPIYDLALKSMPYRKPGLVPYIIIFEVP